jgi:hypothetical protein
MTLPRLFSGLSDFKGDIYLDIESSRLKSLEILDSGEAISCFIFLNNGDGEGKTLMQHLILLFLRFKDRTNRGKFDLENDQNNMEESISNDLFDLDNISTIQEEVEDSDDMSSILTIQKRCCLMATCLL